MARIAIGGFLHETNTFAASCADYCAFRTQEKADLTADRLIAAVTEAEPAFSGRLFSPAEAVAGSLHSAAMVIRHALATATFALPAVLPRWGL